METPRKPKNKLNVYFLVECEQRLTSGYNCTIFAYGQTGAGKTYTMLGKGYDDGEDFDTSSRGIQPRVLEYLFDRIEEVKGRDDAVEALVKASYFEIYNEQIMDLVVEV